MSGRLRNEGSGLMGQYERYEVIEIDREQIKNAPYNPRKIKAEAKKKLKENIEKVGLLAPIVWNKVTGNIVSGHQRISVLDSLSKTKDYKVTVAKVSLDEQTEKEQNIFMNNPSAQGEFDFSLLQELYTDGIDFNLAGFDNAEIFRIFDDKKDDLNAEHLQKLSESIRQNDQLRKETTRKLDKSDNPDFYCVLVFPSRERRDEFFDTLGLEREVFQNGEDIFELMLQS